MNTKTIAKLGCALALSLAPFTASAFTTEKAVRACTAALSVKVSGGDAAWSVDEESLGGGRLDGVEIFHLDARSAANNEVIARADCVVDGRARVKRITTLPLDAEDAAERAISAY